MRRRQAVTLLGQKATPQELQEYKAFVLTLAERVANAHREGGQAVSDAERQAIQQIADTLGTPEPG